MEYKKPIEVVDPKAMSGPKRPLLMIEKVVKNEQKREATLTLQGASDIASTSFGGKGQILRVWDHAPPGDAAGKGAIPVMDDQTNHALDESLTIKFGNGEFKPGDFWLIKVRCRQELPKEIAGQPAARLRYAPLAKVTITGQPSSLNVEQPEDLRLIVAPHVTPASPA
jgi:hypothetical protein